MHIVPKQHANGKPTSRKHKTHSLGETGPSLHVLVDRRRHTIQRDDLRTGDGLSILDKKLRGASAVAISNIEALLDFPPGDRIWLLQALAALPDGVRLADADDARSDVFDAVLKMQVDLRQMSQADAWRSVVLEVGVVKYPASLDMACGRICERVKELGHQAPRRDSLVKDARNILTQLQAAFRRS